MFITLEEETGIANIAIWIWPKVFEARRRVILAAGMIGVRGRTQREGEVMHLMAQHLTYLSADLVSVGERDAVFLLPHGRGDQVRYGGAGPDPREGAPPGFQTRNIEDTYGHIDRIRGSRRIGSGLAHDSPSGPRRELVGPDRRRTALFLRITVKVAYNHPFELPGFRRSG